MRGLRPWPGRVAGLVLMMAVAMPAAALAAVGLPGGATALNEVHDNWTVNCRVSTAKGAPPVDCTVLQQQLSRNTHRRVLGIFLDAGSNGGAKGTLVLPFGLDLGKGVTLQIDDGAVTPPMPFSTCTVGGCLVPLDWTDAAIKALRQGKVVNLAGTAENGQAAHFTIPLDGFSSALDRALALTK